MKKFALLAFVLSLIGLIAYKVYDHKFLSTRFRRIAIAMMDASATGADEMAYLRDARLAVRTARDKKLLDTLERAVATAQESQELSQSFMRLEFDPRWSPVNIMNGGSASKLYEAQDEYRRMGRPIPDQLKSDVAAARARDDRDYKEHQNEINLNLKQQGLDEEELPRLIGAARAELGLPVPPKQ